VKKYTFYVNALGRMERGRAPPIVGANCVRPSHIANYVGANCVRPPHIAGPGLCKGEHSSPLRAMPHHGTALSVGCGALREANVPTSSPSGEIGISASLVFSAFFLLPPEGEMSPQRQRGRSSPLHPPIVGAAIMGRPSPPAAAHFAKRMCQHHPPRGREAGNGL